MSNTFIDEVGIAAKVEKELKKEGTFDKLRKQATEYMRDSQVVQRIEKEMLAKVDEMMESSANLSREEIQRKMLEYIGNNFKMRNDINRQARIELDKGWVDEILDKEIEEKVTKQLENLV